MRNTAPRARDTEDGDFQPVIVPRLERALTPTTPERRANLARFLDEGLAAQDPPNAPAPASGADDFARRVLAAACGLCGGWCCRNGGDDAYLDGANLARILHAQPGMTGLALRQYYLDRVPDETIFESCIFHTRGGCALAAEMRSEICNRYFCGGLAEFLARTADPEQVVIFAGEDGRARRSARLNP